MITIKSIMVLVNFYYYIDKSNDKVMWIFEVIEEHPLNENQIPAIMKIVFGYLRHYIGMKLDYFCTVLLVWLPPITKCVWKRVCQLFSWAYKYLRNILESKIFSAGPISTSIITGTCLGRGWVVSHFCFVCVGSMLSIYA